jgi:hypothetical protein
MPLRSTSSPQGRLDLIVSEERLLASPPFGSSRRTVCLRESDTYGVEALLSIGQFAGWGIVLRRDWVCEQTEVLSGTPATRSGDGQ